MAYEDDVQFRIGVVDHPNNAAAMSAMVSAVRSATTDIGKAVGTVGDSAAAQVSRIEQALDRLNARSSQSARSSPEARLTEPKIDLKPIEVEVIADTRKAEASINRLSDTSSVEVKVEASGVEDATEKYRKLAVVAKEVSEGFDSIESKPIEISVEDRASDRIEEIENKVESLNETPVDIKIDGGDEGIRQKISAFDTIIEKLKGMNSMAVAISLGVDEKTAIDAIARVQSAIEGATGEPVSLSVDSVEMEAAINLAKILSEEFESLSVQEISPKDVEIRFDDLVIEKIRSVKGDVESIGEIEPEIDVKIRVDDGASEQIKAIRERIDELTSEDVRDIGIQLELSEGDVLAAADEAKRLIQQRLEGSEVELDVDSDPIRNAIGLVELLANKIENLNAVDPNIIAAKEQDSTRDAFDRGIDLVKELGANIDTKFSQMESALADAVERGAGASKLGEIRQEFDTTVRRTAEQFIQTKLDAGAAADALLAFNATVGSVFESLKDRADQALSQATNAAKEKKAAAEPPVRKPDPNQLAKLPDPEEYYGEVIKGFDAAIERLNAMRDTGAETGDSLKKMYREIRSEMEDALQVAKFKDNPLDNVLSDMPTTFLWENAFAEAKNRVVETFSTLTRDIEESTKLPTLNVAEIRAGLSGGSSTGAGNREVKIKVSVTGEEDAYRVTQEMKDRLFALTADEIDVKLGLDPNLARDVLVTVEGLLVRLRESPDLGIEFTADTRELVLATQLLEDLQAKGEAVSELTVKVGGGPSGPGPTAPGGPGAGTGPGSPVPSRGTDISAALDELARQFQERKDAEVMEADKLVDTIEEQQDRIEAARQKILAAQQGVEDAQSQVEATEAKGPKFERLITGANEALQGITKFSQGLAFLGLANDESAKSVERFLVTIAKVKGVGDIVVGLGKSVSGVLKFFNQFGASAAERAKGQEQLEKKTELLDKTERAYERTVRKAEKSIEAARNAAKRRLTAIGAETDALNRNTSAQNRNNNARGGGGASPRSRRGAVAIRGTRGGRIGGVAAAAASNLVTGGASNAAGNLIGDVASAGVEVAIERGVTRVAGRFGSGAVGRVAGQALARVGIGGLVGGAGAGGAAAGGAGAAAGAVAGGAAAGAAGISTSTIGLLVAGFAGLAGVVNDVARGNSRGVLSLGGAGEGRSKTADLMEPVFRKAIIGPANEVSRAFTGMLSSVGEMTGMFKLNAEAGDFLGTSLVERAQRELAVNRSLNELKEGLKLSAIFAGLQKSALDRGLEDTRDQIGLNTTIFDNKLDPDAELRERARLAQARVDRADTAPGEARGALMRARNVSDGGVVLNDGREVEIRNQLIEAYKGQYAAIGEQIGITKQLIAAKQAEIDSAKQVEQTFQDLSPDERQRTADVANRALAGESLNDEQLRVLSRVRNALPELNEAYENQVSSNFGSGLVNGGEFQRRVGERRDGAAERDALKEDLRSQGEQQADVAAAIAEEQKLVIDTQLRVKIEVELKNIDESLKAEFAAASTQIRNEINKMLQEARNAVQGLVPGGASNLSTSAAQ